MKLGVIGHPISHSKSPVIHQYWMQKHNLTGSYEALDITPENLERDIHALIGKGYKGFNLTLPHKVLALDICNEIDHSAAAIGAVNTIYVRNSKIYGTNTDAFGFIENIKQQEPYFDFKKGKAVVLGAGGAAKAITHGLLNELTPEIYILNRTRSKAEEISAQHKDKVFTLAWTDRSKILKEANLLINTTSLGMKDQPSLDINLFDLSKEALVTDIVYQPLETDLIRAANARGNKTVTGIGMLLHQARPAFEKWFGVLPEIDAELERLVLP